MTKFIYSFIIVAVFFANPFQTIYGTEPSGSQFSQLWGEPGGEVWNPDSQSNRLPDFTHVGYLEGNEPIPNWPIGANLSDFIESNRYTNHAQAIMAAIDACKPVLSLVNDTQLANISTSVSSADNAQLIIAKLSDNGEKNLLFRFLYPSSTQYNYFYSLDVNSAHYYSAVAAILDDIDMKTGSSWDMNDLDPDYKEAITNQVKVVTSHPGQAVFIANGTYEITEKVFLTQNDVVLRGENRYATILSFPLGLREIYISDCSLKYTNSQDINNCLSNMPRYQFDEAFLEITADSQSPSHGRSLENFTIAFREEMFEGHFSDLGTNAIVIGGVKDSWVRDVTILNANNGITLNGAEYVSVLNIEFNDFGSGRTNGRSVGHTGIKVKSRYNLIHNIFFTGGVYEHELNTNGARYNVFSKFSGKNMQMDWHGGHVTGNLWTEFDLGEGSPAVGRPTFRGGGGSGSEVLWNINADTPQYYEHIYHVRSNSEPVYQGADMNLNNIVVGLKTTEPNNFEDPNYWHENIDPINLYPRNLYIAQMKLAGKPLPNFGNYGNWIRRRPWSGEDALPDSDPNNNGVPNLLEYAFDMDSANLQLIPKIKTDEQDLIESVIYTWRQNNLASDLSYTVEYSYDLSTWFTANYDTMGWEHTVIDSNVDNDFSSSLHQIKIPIDNSKNIFIRLNVEKNIDE